MIYYCKELRVIEQDNKTIQNHLTKLFEQKVNVLLFQKKNIQSKLAHCLLMYATSMNGISLDYKIDNYGKPYDANKNCYFNISHCKEAVACILGNSPNGIDVECVIKQDCFQKIKKKVCNEKELQLLNNSKNPLVEFTKLWTFKESYLKMLGTGIVGDLRNIYYEICDKSFETLTYNDFVLTYCSNNKEYITEVSLNEIIDFIDFL